MIKLPPPIVGHVWDSSRFSGYTVESVARGNVMLTSNDGDIKLSVESLHKYFKFSHSNNTRDKIDWHSKLIK